jgi:hypothetical protein
MKFLIVIFYLVDGTPKGADVIGAAADAKACAELASDVLMSQPDQLKALIEQGIRPQAHCLPLPEFDERKLVVGQ